MRMPAGATSTQSATRINDVTYAVPYGMGGSRLAYGKVTADYVVQEDKQWHEQVRVSFALPTDRVVNLIWKALSTVGRGSGSDANGRMGSYFMQFRVDGKIINEVPTSADGLSNVCCDEVMSTRYYEARTVDYDVKLGAGVHQVSVWVYGNKAYLTYPVTLKTRIIKVIDRGVSK